MRFVVLQPGHGKNAMVCVVKEYANGLFTAVVVGGDKKEIGTNVFHPPCPVVCLRIICSLHWPVYTSAPHLCARESFVCT